MDEVLGKLKCPVTLNQLEAGGGCRWPVCLIVERAVNQQLEIQHADFTPKRPPATSGISAD